MYCSSCGEKLSDDQNFCTKCGTAVKGRSLRIIRLKCSECQGIMDVDFDKQVIQCPYCGSKSLLVESDEIKIEQIRSSANLERERIYRYSMLEREKIRKEASIEKVKIQSNTEIKKAKINKSNPDAKTDQTIAIVFPIVMVVVLLLLLLL